MANLVNKLNVLRTICPLYYSSLVSLRHCSSKAKMKSWKDELVNNPYYGKYYDKISALDQEDPETVQRRLEEVKQPQKPKVSAPKPAPGAPKLPIACGRPQTLWDIINRDMVQDKRPEEISHLWTEYHKTKEVLSAVVPVSVFNTINERGSQYPIFILPIPRDTGYEFVVLAYADTSFHFTTLLNYQTHKENAPECMTLRYFTELKDSGLILMKGEYDKNVLGALEAQCLANLCQLYYGENDPKKTALLEKFTHNPDAFHHMDVIREMESLQ